MLNAFAAHRATLILAPALIVLGLASVIAAGATTIISYFKFQESGLLVTVPDDDVQLQIDPNTPHRIYHRVTGSHITENRPRVTLPDNYTLKITDAASGEPIELTPASGYQQSYFFGFHSRRDNIAAFDAPPSGSISLRASGLDTDTVFYVVQSQDVYERTILPKFAAWVIASAAVLLLGAALIILRLANPSMSIASEHAHRA